MCIHQCTGDTHRFTAVLYRLEFPVKQIMEIYRRWHHTPEPSSVFFTAVIKSFLGSMAAERERRTERSERKERGVNQREQSGDPSFI